MGVDVLRVADELECLPRISEPGLRLGFHGVKPRAHLRGGRSATGKLAGGAYLVPCFLSSGRIPGKGRDEGHVRQHGSANEGVVSVLRGLQGYHEAVLRLRRNLHVEELDPAGKKA